MMKNFEVEMLGVEEAAKIANLTEDHLRELLRLGKIKATKTGRLWRISKDDLNDYLGIKSDFKSFQREIYIKELESEVKSLRLKLKLVESNLTNIFGIMQN